MRTSKQAIDYIMTLAKQDGLNQKELADKVGISEASISRYIHEKREFPIEEVPAFAKALGTTVEDLLGVSVTENQKFPNLSKVISFTQEIGAFNLGTIDSPAFQQKVLEAILIDLRQLMLSENSQTNP